MQIATGQIEEPEPEDVSKQGGAGLQPEERTGACNEPDERAAVGDRPEGSGEAIGASSERVCDAVGNFSS
jgi:hypothetical protein